MSLKVIIIGGGIGGTAAAHALLRVGCEVRIYEQVNAKTEVGAGIQISPNASRLLWRYGLAEALKQRAVRPAALEVRRWDDGATLSREDLGDTIEREYGAPYYHFHRADLLSVLSDALPAGALQTARRCVGAVQSEHGVRVDFEDGASVEGDVLVGADGIHSTIRRTLFGDERPRFSGNVAYRGLAPVERIAHLDLPHIGSNWWGPGGHFVHYFVAGGRFLNFVAVSEQANWERESWTDRGSIDDARRCYEGWHPQIHAILNAVDETFKWALFDRAPLEQLERRPHHAARRRLPPNAALHGAGGSSVDRGWGDAGGLPHRRLRCRHRARTRALRGLAEATHRIDPGGCARELDHLPPS